MYKFLCFFIVLYFFITLVGTQSSSKNKKKKDIRDYTEAEIEKIYEQWEDSDEDELEEDELPEWKRKGPTIDLTKLDLSHPQQVLEATKKGKTLMMFATIAGSPSSAETEQISSMWQQGLYNGHIDVQRYVVGDKRILFVLSDGGYAWKVKDYLVSLDSCESVTIEGKDYPGKGSGEKSGKNEASNSHEKNKANLNEAKNNKKNTEL